MGGGGGSGGIATFCCGGAPVLGNLQGLEVVAEQDRDTLIEQSVTLIKQSQCS